ncbi:MAG: transcription antitermination factor NusB [Leptospirales bacterium]
MKIHRARVLAMQAVYQLEFNDRTVEEISTFDWIDYKIPDDEKEFSLNLVKGVQEYSEIINKAIVTYSTNWKIERISHVSRAVLRISIYQLMKTDIPYKSVIDEAIRLAKEYGEDDSERFINGILDTYYKEEIMK